MQAWFDGLWVYRCHIVTLGVTVWPVVNKIVFGHCLWSRIFCSPSLTKFLEASAGTIY